MRKRDRELLLIAAGSNSPKHGGRGIQHRSFCRVDQEDNIHVAETFCDASCNASGRVANVAETFTVKEDQPGPAVSKFGEEMPLKPDAIHDRSEQCAKCTCII